MSKFIFEVKQPADTFFDGLLMIEASSEKEAVEKIRTLSQRELEDLCEPDRWVVGNDTWATGDIEVYDKNGGIINE